VAGLRRLWLIETRHLLGFIEPRTLGGFIASNWLLAPFSLQLGEDTRIVSVKFPASRGSYNQKAQVGVQGVLYDQNLTFIVPRDHPTTTLFAQRVAGRRFVAIYEDANGLRKLIGTYKQPLRFSSELRTNPSAWSFSLSCQTKQPSYAWTDDGLLDTIGLDADFSFGFDYDFAS
jgi:hypothetical protein